LLKLVSIQFMVQDR